MLRRSLITPLRFDKLQQSLIKIRNFRTIFLGTLIRGDINTQLYTKIPQLRISTYGYMVIDRIIGTRKGIGSSHSKISSRNI